MMVVVTVQEGVVATDIFSLDNVQIKLNDNIEKDEVIRLYEANEWSSAQKPEALLGGLRASHSLVTARFRGDLVGIANAISDGHLVVYYPHMLVDPNYHGKGIGSKMMGTLQAIYGAYHQQMLTADGKSVKFYKTLGFEKAGNTQSMWIYKGRDHE